MGNFLRARRAQLTPEQVGLPSDAARRRVPGLRRSELAQLSGVSVDYYIRLEQGRANNVSDEVLGALARTLGLSYDEREHLSNLARQNPHPSRPEPPNLRGVLRDLLRMMDAVPAFVLDGRLDVLEFNPLADALFGFASRPAAERNVLRSAFLDDGAQARYPNLHDVAAGAVAFLRFSEGRESTAARDELITDLLARSPGFRAQWERQEVTQRTTTTVRVQHPVVGELELDNVWLCPPGIVDEVVVAYTAASGSASERRLRELAGSSQPS